MKPIGILHPTEILPAPDTVFTFVIAGGSSVHKWDWPSGTVHAVFGSNVDFFANMASTYCVMPSSDLSTGSSAAHGFWGSSVAQELNPTARRIPQGSTGGSLTAATTGIITIALFSV